MTPFPARQTLDSGTTRERPFWKSSQKSPSCSRAPTIPPTIAVESVIPRQELARSMPTFHLKGTTSDERTMPSTSIASSSPVTLMTPICAVIAVGPPCATKIAAKSGPESRKAMTPWSSRRTTQHRCACSCPDMRSNNADQESGRSGSMATPVLRCAEYRQQISRRGYRLEDTAWTRHRVQRRAPKRRGRRARLGRSDAPREDADSLSRTLDRHRALQEEVSRDCQIPRHLRRATIHWPGACDSRPARSKSRLRHLLSLIWVRSHRGSNFPAECSCSRSSRGRSRISRISQRQRASHQTRRECLHDMGQQHGRHTLHPVRRRHR